MYAKAKLRLMLIMALSVSRITGCAPIFESHIDAPAAIRAPDAQPIAAHCAAADKIAPLDPRPQLPDAEQSPCPPGSGLAACFTPSQDAVRQDRFKILHADRDYCRDAYDRAVKRAAGE
jgi:hypothetical protein